jgi:hypothetical protein
MKIISHRGNVRGPVGDKENRPSYIDCALGNGYDVEIDLRIIDNELWLGHDEPQYKVTHRWIRERRNNLWIHCKNFEASKQSWIYQSFCHSGDPFTYTSTGKLWLHDLTQEIDSSVIIPLLSMKEIEEYSDIIVHKNVYGICTDYPILF